MSCGDGSGEMREKKKKTEKQRKRNVKATNLFYAGVAVPVVLVFVVHGESEGLAMLRRCWRHGDNVEAAAVLRIVVIVVAAAAAALAATKL